MGYCHTAWKLLCSTLLIRHSIAYTQNVAMGEVSPFHFSGI